MKTRACPESRSALASALLALTLGLAASCVSAQQALTQEEKLSAIRQGLVQAAIEGPTKVQSTVWIDAQGALQESSSFRTGMEVRGVRVLSYERDSQGQPTADLRWQDAGRASHAAAREQPLACKALASAGRLQHVIGLSIATASEWTVDELPAIKALENSLLSQWRGAAGGTVVWRMATSTGGPRSAYEKALLGSSADQVPWQAKLSLRPLTRQVPWLVTLRQNFSEGPMVSGPSPEVLLQLDFSLTARNQYEPLFEAHTQIKWRTDRPSWEAGQLSLEAQDLFAQQLQSWSQEIRQRLVCEPVLPEVILSSRDGVRINAGALAGVRVGDEWLLADGKNYMRQILEPGVVAQSVLAKVQSVGEHHAQLQLIAGPQSAVQRSWRAWSTETLR
jgi:hypothetical protein